MRTTDNLDSAVSHYADAVMRMICEDQTEGAVPTTVTSFAELHDHVDANEYTITAEVPYDLMTEGGMDLVHAVEAEVSDRLAALAC